MGYRGYGVANGFIVNPNGQGDFKTITAACAVATSGDVLYLFPATYMENFTLPAGVNITALGNCSFTPTVTIVGTITYSSAGTSTITGCRLQTNGANCLTFSGSGVSNLFLEQCFINCTNNDGINFSNSNASSLLQLYRCSGDTTTTGIRIYNVSSPGDFVTKYTNFENSGNSLTSSNSSAGVTQHTGLTSHQPISTSGTATIYVINSDIDMTTFTNTNNFTCLAANGTGQGLVVNSYLNSNNADTITIGAGNALSVQDVCLSSASGRVLSGSGTVVLGTVNCAFTNGISVGARSLQGTCISPRFVVAGPAGELDLESGTTLFVESGALVDVQAGAKLQVDSGAEIDLPLSGLLVGNSAGVAVSAIALTTNGQIPIGGISGPVAANITGTGITVTNGANTIALSLTNPSGVAWTDVTGATQNLAVNQGYVTDHANVTYTLPASASLGDVIMILGKTGITTITPNANQQILMGAASGTVGVTGTAVGTDAGDNATLRCITSGSSTVWRMQSWVGKWNLT